MPHQESARVLPSVLEAIGNSPLVRLSKGTPAGSAPIFGKLEYLNPSGSVKDRTALADIEDAEARGALKPGGTIVEATSGNMGPALAMVGAARGYKVVIVLPSDAPDEIKRRVSFYGAVVVTTPSVQGMEGAVRHARSLAAEGNDSFLVDQFANRAGIRAHREGTGREIVQAMGERRVDAFVAGVGTGATLVGVAQALRARYPTVAIVAVEPAQSMVLSKGVAGPHRIAGIGPTFVPPILDRSLVTEIVSVTDEDAYARASDLARLEGLMAGPSSGANLAAALQVAARLGEARTVVTVFPDSWERYLRSPI